MKKLYFKEKFFIITDHYPIVDENGREVYYLDQNFTLVGYNSNVSDADGKNLFSITREIFTLLPRYQVVFSKGTNMTVQKKFEFFRHRVDIFMSNGDNLYLDGDIWHLNFQVINKEGALVGEVYKKFFSFADNYELTIYDENYDQELISLVLCLNNMVDLEKATSN